ncbi:hypothetical protein B0T14DRAFT_570001 [Immersiella caudata]|uniref:Uncharacterized protein n=1 Tax=Immersiella caudata TaxID=314043 RepID=A0AA39WEP3_9PEZI|nr:hypothetical protein B0T14DRAFT_570001 [Immersiella caudata]
MTTSTSTSLHTPNPTTPPNPAEIPQPVNGINIFWIIFILALTSAWHPFGAAPDFPPKIRRYIPIFPLTSLLDTLLLYGEFTSPLFSQNTNERTSLRSAARAVSIR